MFADDVMKAIQWFFELHSQGRDSLTKEEVLRLSESLLFCDCLLSRHTPSTYKYSLFPCFCYSLAVFRNEPEDGYLGAVSELIGQSFLHGGEGGASQAAAAPAAAPSEKAQA